MLLMATTEWTGCPDPSARRDRKAWPAHRDHKVLSAPRYFQSTEKTVSTDFPDPSGRKVRKV